MQRKFEPRLVRRPRTTTDVALRRWVMASSTSSVSSRSSADLQAFDAGSTKARGACASFDRFSEHRISPELQMGLTDNLTSKPVNLIGFDPRVGAATIRTEASVGGFGRSTQ